ncbi:hypothetical protein SAMN05444362_103229 [Dysgonomonas macrotermitis]|uniref:Uncharacterized protein n=1 Tax=Dysgonomonas macrotermitis TaxID=1346286 RepID=A0A1M4YNV0_9BACT|nr:hypothetical protein SAMN05444362_103229 [Dysgonomonas macrotermitis]
MAKYGFANLVSKQIVYTTILDCTLAVYSFFRIITFF